ncbi:MAG TPA: TetR/AcrR family transcriptional regulator [Desulfobacteraceae bacterium]|nr:TetR/AcrR family transcriptional regulator [Deltaproteobacteria bacterium]RLB98178.1 MAG: TetR/AcrR family transcriptional regulator [Deltaproteobacteria bacterium]HDI61208.1 TetR/AcrR family transcriptional regulator [Desulfobacteraceae bacterium]
MPKETFFKIDEDKRERLLREAAGLFAERGFNQTDMAQLASRAGIAKGSIYNYFESKEDLYLYVCRDGMQRSREAIYGRMDPEWDIYRQIEHIFRQGARFVQSHPEYLILYANISSAGMERFSEQMSLEVEKYTADHLKRLIRRDMQRGLVRDDVNVNFAAFMVNSLYIILMASLVSSHFKIRLQEYLEMGDDFTEAALEPLIQGTTNMINNLLRPV